MLLRNVHFASIGMLRFWGLLDVMSIFFFLAQSLIYKSKGYRINFIPESFLQFLPGSNLII